MKIIAIGCSFTEGQGLKNQKIECYTHQLAKKLNLDYFNFGMCGTSNDYIFRKTFQLINDGTITKEDIILIQWTHYNRKELPFAYDDKMWYHYVPSSMHVYTDTKIIDYPTESIVKVEYYDEDLDAQKLYIESQNKSSLENYILKFLNEDYQKNNTINYINSLYTYLEHFGYNHFHFFGWNGCFIESVIENKENFIKETFGGYTNTKTLEHHVYAQHPDKEGHLKWSEFLYEKIIPKVEIKPKKKINDKNLI